MRHIFNLILFSFVTATRFVSIIADAAFSVVALPDVVEAVLLGGLLVVLRVSAASDGQDIEEQHDEKQPPKNPDAFGTCVAKPRAPRMRIM